VKRFYLLGLAVFLTLACAACGGGGTRDAARSQALPPSLVKQIRAAVREPSPISGVLSTRTVEVYGPASHVALERAASGSSASLHYSGDWYLIVRRGHFAGNLPVPPGGKEPQARIAMEVWSPKATTGRAFSFADRLPAAVSRLRGHAVIHLS
jgi:hypothetical protein